jgi:hypothetical protein
MAKNKKSKRPAARKVRWAGCEPLERRTLFAALQWVSEGPSPQIDAGNVIGPTPAMTEDVGAVEALAVDPNNSKHVIAGTVNGGVWQTQDFTAATPSWTTTTDQMPSLSIQSVAFSPVNSNVIYAGTGGTSSLAINGPDVGIYKSINGGATWQVLNPPTAAQPNGIFTGLGILRIIPTTLNGGQTVFVAIDPDVNAQGVAAGGVYRSDDGGASWTQLSGSDGLPIGGVTDLVENPDNHNQFFAAIPETVGGASAGANAGIYALNLGVSNNWVNVTNNIVGADVSTSERIELSVSPAGVNPVWASIVNTHSYLQRIYRGVQANGTLNWAQVGPLSGGSREPPDVYVDAFMGYIHGAIEADPNNDTLVYVGGTAVSSPYTGAVVRGDSTANTWTALAPYGTHSAAIGTAAPTSNGDTTAPHPDSRAFVFASGGVLLDACDGGIYQCTDPSSTVSGSQVWTFVAGATTATTTGIQDTEFTNIAYDSQFHVILGGAQDVGTPAQTAQGSFVYKDQSGGDGGFNMVDDFTLAKGESIRYTFGTTREYYSGATTLAANQGSNTLATPQHVPDILPPLGLVGFGPFNALFTMSILNAIGPTAAQREAHQSTGIVVSGGTDAAVPVGAVYESFNAGTAPETTEVINGKTDYYAEDAWNEIPTGPGFVSTSVMAYGGSSGGVSDPAVLYAASGSQIFLRTTAGGTLTATPAQPAGAGNIKSITLDADDWKTAFVSDGTHIFMTTDAGSHWTNITGTLANPGEAMAFVTPLDELLVGGIGGLSHGVSGMVLGDPGVWSTFGVGLPNAIILHGLVYNAADDVVVAGTLGRGAWELKVPAPYPLVINGTSKNDLIEVNETSAGGVSIYNDGITYNYAPGMYTSVTVDSGAGMDTILVSATVVPTTINSASLPGGPDDAVIIGSSGETTSIAAPISISNPTGDDTIVIADTVDSVAKNVTIEGLLTNGMVVTGIGAGDISFVPANTRSVAVYTGTGDNTVNVLDTGVPTTILDHGTDTIDVQATNAPLMINANGSRDAINVGSLAPNSGGTLTALADPITIMNTAATSSLVVDDSGDSVGRTGTISATSLAGFGLPGSSSIKYPAQLASLTVYGGSGDNTDTITGTSVLTSLIPGGGTSVPTAVNVQAVGANGSLTITGGDETDDIAIGSLAPTLGGTLNNIAGSVNLTGTFVNSTLVVDDSGDTVGRTGMISSTSVTGFGLPAASSVNYSALASGQGLASFLIVRGGSGANTETVTGTSVPTTLYPGAPGSSAISTVNVQAMSAPLTINGNDPPVNVNIGSLAPRLGGMLSHIDGSITITNTIKPSTLTLDDSGDTTPRTGTLSPTSISGLGLGAGAVVNYIGSELSSLTLRGSAGGATLTETGTSVRTTLIGITQAAPMSLVVQMSPSLDNLTLRVDPANASDLEVLNGSSVFEDVPFNSISSVMVKGGHVGQK